MNASSAVSLLRCGFSVLDFPIVVSYFSFRPPGMESWPGKTRVESGRV
jgi:hypothetical protein